MGRSVPWRHPTNPANMPKDFSCMDSQLRSKGRGPDETSVRPSLHDNNYYGGYLPCRPRPAGRTAASVLQEPTRVGLSHPRTW